MDISKAPTTKLEEPGKTIEPLLLHVDALMLTRGILRSCVDPEGKKPIILRVSGGTSMVRRDELDQEGITTSVREAIRLNASAVSMSIFTTSYGAGPGDLKESLDLIKENKVNVQDMVTHRLSLEEAGLGFKLVAKAGESLKVIIKPHD